MALKKESPPRFTEQFVTFTSETTLHGISRITARESGIFRRIIWSLSVLALFIYFLVSMGTAFGRWKEHDVSTKVTVLEQSPLEFPAVTICDYNSISRVELDKDPERAKIIAALNGLGDMEEIFNNPSLLKIIHNENMYNFSRTFAPKLEDTMLECKWKAAKIECGEYFRESLTSWGFCYTFNSATFIREQGYRMNATRTGNTQGLWIQLNANQDEYYLQQQGTRSAGFKVLLHEENVAPRVDELGFAVSPGSETLVAVRETRVTKLPSPFKGSDCLDTNAKDYVNPLKFYQSYSKDACRTECQTNYYYKQCGCTPYNYPSTYRNCSGYESADCVQVANGNYTEYDAIEAACNCRESCTERYYSPTLSSASYPSTLVMDTLLQSYPNMSHSYISENLLEVWIYFEALSYEKIEQVEAYSLTDLQADIGGNLGLCIGASLLTVAEFVEFFGLAFYYCCKRITLARGGRIEKEKNSNGVQPK